jgi:C-terminal processing protease CtpA/Prc
MKSEWAALLMLLFQVKLLLRYPLIFLRLALFNNKACKQLRTVISYYINRGINIKGIVLDLRNNGGGNTQGAIETATYFIQSGII